ncbi:MAG: sigma-70 family RNA polymerase sigma factor [Blastocatellia bacterium]
MGFQQIYSNTEERELIAAAQQGDRTAFKALYENHRDRVYNLIFYFLTDVRLVEDVLQNVFLKVYRGLPQFRFEANLATWIYRVTINECQNQNRRNGARYVPFETILGSGEEIDRSSTPDDWHARNERREIVQRAVLQLSPKLRAVVVLKYLEGLSYDEIAEALECAPGTVASRLNRALEELESRLRPLKHVL